MFTRDNMLQSLPSNYEQFPTMHKINIHPSGVKKLWYDLDTIKATGPDLIPTRVLKLAPVLAELFQNSIDTGIVPDDWLTANVVGIYKKGDKQEPANYRPVSLTSVTCKVLEHIIYSQIMSHYNKHNFLSKYQHGFRRGYSCETQLLATVEDIQRGIDSSSNRYDLIILDFTKAFDKGSFTRLIFKLKQSGVNKSLLLWINNWLTHGTQRVVVDGCQSREAAVTSGVPQGTVLGPLFFLVYINDIQRNISSKLRLFADDSLLYRQITKPEDEDIFCKKTSTNSQSWPSFGR